VPVFGHPDFFTGEKSGAADSGSTAPGPSQVQQLQKQCARQRLWPD